MKFKNNDPSFLLKQRKIFRAYDIRGHVAVLNPSLVNKIAYRLGQAMKAKDAESIVVGFDARATSAEYAKIVEKELSDLGLNVISIGCVSSPLLYFTAQCYGGFGIMITASHNAVTDNGIKWLIAGLPPTPEQIQDLAYSIELENNQSKLDKSGCVQHLEPLPAYLDYLQQDIGALSNIKICVEGLNGSAGAIAKQALTTLGAVVIDLHCDANSEFPLGPPDPSCEQRLSFLKQSVLDHHADLGIALDGDGDRVVIVDEHARIISPDRLLSLFAKICLMAHPHKQIVCDVKCSSLVAKTTHQYGGELHMMRTGSSFLRNYLAQSHHYAVFGGEFAGHYVFNDGRGRGYDDGLYAALRVIEFIQQQAKPLSEILKEFPERIATEDLYIDCANADYDEICKYIQSNVPSEAQIIQVDGLRLDFPFGFGIIRPSNTGEYFTVRFDADNKADFNYIKQIFVDALSPHYPSIAQAMAVAHSSTGAFHVS